MARTYKRDARGRFAGGGYSGQTGGRGARLKSGGNTRAGGGVKVGGVKRSTPAGAIRRTDVIRARVENGISKNIERRNKAGLNPPTAAKENKAARVKRAAGRIAARGGVQGGKRGPMSTAEKKLLDMAQGDLAVNKERLKGARQRKAAASNPLEKLKATSRIGEYQLNVNRASDRVKRIKARPIFAPRPTSGRGSAQTIASSKAKRPGSIRGKVSRDRMAGAKMPTGASLQAGRYKNVYINNANNAAARATAKPRRR